eukprot:9469947-Pyramimonas_sp.AAC.2
MADDYNSNTSGWDALMPTELLYNVLAAALMMAEYHAMCITIDDIDIDDDDHYRDDDNADCGGNNVLRVSQAHYLHW